ncbi:hypothetical protein M430DRAFT_235348 [Amorphotheca resinae ATCC 22711]|uniref:Uncharacterized protein n=1 Tax=Amorphotheca resinae ATCC 22711 TaxID=857342 RepID=A0A2T3B4H8_AMORE|nr:hypothetical protein M430DRAFT_235348 [Amorphotheca resinae ATCC 22711]PSS20555.1 hypothetical protein M430DRAFT_235348 [Amorphotheca resinae ATCC 22711]
MADYLQTSPRLLMAAGQWKDIKLALDSDTSNQVFFVDMEFGQLGTGEEFVRHLFEVSIYNAKGECLIDTTVDYGITILELAGWCPSRRWTNCIQGIYGNDFERRTPGLRVEDLADKFAHVGINTNSTFVEWSTNGCDATTIIKSMSDVGRGELLPPRGNWVSGIPMWRGIMPGARTLALQPLHAMLFAETTLLDHHHAAVDTRKLWEVMKEGYCPWGHTVFLLQLRDVHGLPISQGCRCHPHRL